MKISVIDPLSPALDRTKQVLFEPFDLGKWFTLGFCAFLATLGDGGGGSSNFPGSFPSGDGGGDKPNFEPAWQWVQQNMALILSIAAAVLVAGCLFGLIITWLSSRGKFMFIDGIVNNRGAVIAPWHEYRREGNSLFWFRVLYGVGCFLIIALLIGGCAVIAMPSIQAQEFDSSAVTALIVGVPLMILFAITAGLISLCLNHFVIPIMYLRRSGVMAAWGEFHHEILSGRIGTLILYVIVQIVMGFGIGVLALLATCLTCCLTAIPYLGSVILLPLSTFTKSYDLCFLEQFGPGWMFYQGKQAGSPPSPVVGDGAQPDSDETNPFRDRPLT